MSETGPCQVNGSPGAIETVAETIQYIHADRLGSSGIMPLWDNYNRFGLEGITRGFMRARQQAGEPEFQGLLPTRVSNDERTPPVLFLELMSRRKLAFSEWDDEHDFHKHLAGALLISKAVGDIMQQGAEIAMKGDERVQKAVLKGLDHSTYFTQYIWLGGQHDKEKYTAILGNNLNEIVEATELPYDNQEVYAIARDQQTFIDEVASKQSLT